MVKCFMCGQDTDTRKVMIGRARGFTDVCFDCVLKFYKIDQEKSK
ncbi:MAG: hypothetical protein ABIJ10_04620 [Candidatus Micrarchaeota archaeon]